MSEERFNAIEKTLDAHTNTLDAHTRTLDEHTAKLDRLHPGQEEMQTHLLRVDNRLDRLEINVEVLKDDVKQIAEGPAATLAAIDRATETIVGRIEPRGDLLELAFRKHLNASM